MDSKTPRKLLAEMLEDLTMENFQKFVHDLVDRREEPRVRRSRVEEKSYLVVADVMVSTFTEKKAPSVAAEILRRIGCTEEAQQLLKQAEMASSSGSFTEKHFVDKHFSELIDRVSCVEPILDQLLQKEVIKNEAYNSIRSKPTSQAKMRELLDHLRASPAHKDIFYHILKKEQKLLVEDLEENSKNSF